MNVEGVERDVSTLWQGDDGKRRHVDSVTAECLECGTTETVPSENSSFRCSSGHSQTFFRCADCKATFQNVGIGAPCPYCLSAQRDGQVTAWEWMADRLRYPLRESLRPRWPSARHPRADSDRRLLHDFFLAACGGSQLPAEVHCSIDFASDAITIFVTAGQFNVVRHALSAVPKESLRYEDVVALQVTGTTTRSNAGVFGGGFGIVGAAEGMLAAAVINSLTSKTKIYTLLRLATARAEYVFVSYSVDSSALQLALTPVQVRIRQATAALAAGTPTKTLATGISVADELRKLAALRDEGILSEVEFASAKAKLLNGT